MYRLSCAVFLLLVLVVILALPCSAESAVAKQPVEQPSPTPSLEILLDKPSPEIDSATKQTRDTLSEMHPSLSPTALGEPRLLVTPDHRGVLVGDFARDGNSYALVELSFENGETQPGLAFAVWKNGQWQLRGLWKISPNWKAEGRQSGDESWKDFVDTQAFRLAHLEGDSALWVLMPSDVDKYRQDYAFMRFNPEGKRLDLLGFSTEQPKFLPGGWLRLYSNSGRRSIWEEWEFLRLRNNKLVPYASWHGEVPYNNVDPSFVDVERYNTQGHHWHSYKITDEESGNDHEDIVSITRDEQKFATVTFAWPQSLVQEVPESLSREGVERAYLFEKLTGVPRSLYPDNTADFADKPQPRLEDVAAARVKGSVGAASFLSAPAPSARRKQRPDSPGGG